MNARILTSNFAAPQLKASVVAMGVFDGVHLGHQALIRDTVALALSRGVESCVLTFDRDPDQVIAVQHAAPQLMTLDDKVAAIVALGIDTVLVIPFDAALAAMPPLEFLDTIVVPTLRPVAVLVGHDFRFGCRAHGDVDTLRQDGAVRSYDVVAHDLVVAGGKTVTSTRIRALVESGHVAEAAVLLGRPHRVTGRVVHGRGAGIEIGTPTLNIEPVPFAALPADGVYAGRAVTPLGTYAAGVSVGLPPMFPEATDRLEAHLLDFAGDLYGADVVIEFTERLRDQRVFGSVDELAVAISEDLTRIRAIVPPADGPH